MCLYHIVYCVLFRQLYRQDNLNKTRTIKKELIIKRSKNISIIVLVFMPTLFTCVVYNRSWQDGLIQYNTISYKNNNKEYSFVLGGFYNVLICNIFFISNRIISICMY